MKFPTRCAIMPIPAALIFALLSYPTIAANEHSIAATSKRAPHRVQSSTTTPDPGVGATCAYDRAAGRCMIDLGNGRCMECNAGPMK